MNAAGQTHYRITCSPSTCATGRVGPPKRGVNRATTRSGAARLPFTENRLKVAVRAGEKIFLGSSHDWLASF